MVLRSPFYRSKGENMEKELHTKYNQPQKPNDPRRISMEKQIKILWKNPNQQGKVELRNAGMLAELSGGTNTEGCFAITDGILNIRVADAKLTLGSFATIVTVRAEDDFSFFLRDIRKDCPVYIPEYQVVVTEAEDLRNYDQIVSAICAEGRKTKIQQMESSPEESFEAAASHNRDMAVPIWLGLSRDVRMFEGRIHTLSNLGYAMDTIQPMNHSTPIQLEEVPNEPIRYDYFAGRGVGCRREITRYLENRVLPILNVINVDDEIRYHQQMFVTLEHSVLTKENVHGTHYLVADLYARSPTERTPEQQAETDRLHDAEIQQAEETVLFLRITAENTSRAPKYAYMRIPQPNVFKIAELSVCKPELEDGLAYYKDSGKVFMTATLNGQPVQDVEYAVLLGAGEKCVFEFKLPHMPISKERAQQLMSVDYDRAFAECVQYWQNKLDKLAKIQLPEQRIEEMMKAGFLHLDLISFGNEPNGPVAPTVGIYTPIGTESTPIIQYIESMGDTELAQRAIEYFVNKQRPDGFMQNFSTYMSETGLGLWNVAQHYWFTRDKQWLRSVADNLVRGCDYIADWTKESKIDNRRKKGYGMISGKVADCAYPFHSYMLNSTTYGGVKNCADVLAQIGDPNAERIAAFAAEYKANIRETLAESFAIAPVIPLADGSWCPAIAQWPEIAGPMCLFTDGGKTFSHGMMVECSENGCYDIMYGIVDPNSAYGSFIVKMVTELIALENTAFSQPYYSVHPYAHLLRGEVRSFLKEFYNNVSALADRETYTFWEHQYQESPHKTHEEAWFLMRCRWLLYMDAVHELRFLPAVPRKWLEDGKQICFEGMKSRFGILSLNLKSAVAEGRVDVTLRIEPMENDVPKKITLRVPHPEGAKALKVSEGRYDSETETVELPMFRGEKTVTFWF